MIYLTIFLSLANLAGLGVIAFLLYRLLEEITIALEHNIWKGEPEKFFICHYCSNRFPIKVCEKIGPYEYCPEHGIKRSEKQKRVSEEIVHG